MTSVPCVRIETMTPAQKRAYVLADNKLALNAGWDEELLAEELKGLLADDGDFDVSLTGFSIAEVDTLVEGLSPEEPGDPDDDVLPPLGDGEAPLPAGRHLGARTASADLRQRARSRCRRRPDEWREGPDGVHRPALQRSDRRPCRRAGRGQAPRVRDGVRRDDDRRSSPPSSDRPSRTWCASASTARSTSSAWTGGTWPRCWPPVPPITELKNLIVWAKDNGGMGTFYRSRHELVFAFKNGTAPHINSFELGQHGRYRTNVWQYRGMNSMASGRMDELALHPTVKPVAMIVDAIKDVSERGAIVLDLFGGSGSTLIAAHKTGRRGYLCELDPIYCDRILRRWELSPRTTPS